MWNDSGEYVQIEYSSGFGLAPPQKVYADALPDVYVTNAPVELQEFFYSAQGKGYRNAYSYRPTTRLRFSTAAPPKNKLHKHDYFELMLIASPRVEMQIESQLCEFGQGDVCILNRSTRHAEKFCTEEKLFYLVLAPEYLAGWPREEGMSLQQFAVLSKFFNKGLRDTFQQNKDYTAFRCINREGGSPLYGIMADIRREFEDKKPGYQLFVRGHIYRLLSVLADPACYAAEYIDLGADDGFSLAFSARRLLDKTKRRMTKLEIAEKLNYSEEYVNRVFKKHYGYTIPEYNRLVCLRQAAALLCGTSLPVHEICKQLGFANRTHFYSLFHREYGCTPYDYRKTAHRG